MSISKQVQQNSQWGRLQRIHQKQHQGTISQHSPPPFAKRLRPLCGPASNPSKKNLYQTGQLEHFHGSLPEFSGNRDLRQARLPAPIPKRDRVPPRPRSFPPLTRLCVKRTWTCKPKFDPKPVPGLPYSTASGKIIRFSTLIGPKRLGATRNGQPARCGQTRKTTDTAAVQTS